MLAKTAVTQRSPCYCAVSALLMNPLQDRSNYSPLLPHPLPHSGSILHKSLRARPFIEMLHWRLILHCCSTTESSLELRKNAVLAEQQAEASVDVPYLPLQFVNSVPFCLFSLYLNLLSAPFLNPHSSPSPPSLPSLLINSLSS